MRGVTLAQLQAFAAVVEHGSFSAAAERLDVTQPAVSLQVHALERRLGVRLVERVGRRAGPTLAGAELVEHARRVEDAVSGAVAAMQRHVAGGVGRVRLGTGATACIYLLPPLLRRVRERHPGVEIVVKTGNTVDILAEIEANRVDVGLVTLPAPGRAFEVTPVVEDEFVAVAARGAMTLPPEVTPLVLAELPVVLYEPGANTRRMVDEWSLAGGVALKPAMELGSVEAMKEMIRAGLGCGVLPRMAVEKPAAGLVVRPLKPRLRRTLALVLRRDKPLNWALREVTRALSSLGRRRA
jgi:DNA-binding transcriptional LysR family regulator